MAALAEPVRVRALEVIRKASMPGQPKSHDHVAKVAAGYDLVGDDYYRHYRTVPTEVVERYESLFIEHVPAGGTVLELGCGNGLPMTAKLADRFEVTAVDVSDAQIDRARQNVPGPRYVHADMSALDLPEASFDGVAAFYSIIHVPRDRHAGLFRSIFSWLRPGGLFVATLGSAAVETELEEDWFGAPMYWSSFDAGTYRALIEEAGYDVESDGVEVSDDPESESEKEIHLWIVARRLRKKSPRAAGLI